MADLVLLRGVLTPWGHPLYTAMAGIGIGVARETPRGSLKFLAPLVGFACAVLLHTAWNATALRGELSLESENLPVTLSLWGVFVVVFLGIVLGLVVRRGRIIRAYLRDEVKLGTLTEEDLVYVVRPFGILRARVEHGAVGAKYVRACARLGLLRWHSMRASKGHYDTISLHLLGPLKKRVRKLRKEFR